MALTSLPSRPAPRLRTVSAIVTKTATNGSTHVPAPFPAAVAPLEPPQPPVDRAGSRPVGPSMAKRLIVAVIIGMILGGTVGSLAGMSATQSWTASALVQIANTPDPGLAAVAGGATSDSAITDFTAAEIAWLSGNALTAAVQQRLDSTDVPEITIARVGLSSVVRFTGKATSAAAALHVTQAAVDVYTQRRADAVRKTVADSLASVNRTIADVQAQGPVAAPKPTDDSDRLTKLYDLRANLLLLQNSRASTAPVLQPTTLDKQSGSPTVVGSALGAVVGGLIAVVLFAFWRSRTTTVVTPADAGAVVDRLLLPLVDLGRDWRGQLLRVATDRDRRTSRRLAAQLACASRPAGRVVIVAGPSADSGSRAVSTMMAVALADRTPTVLALVGGRPVDHPLGSHLNGEAGFPPGPAADPERMASEVPRLELLSLSEHAAGPGWPVVEKLMQAGLHCVVIDLGAHAHLAKSLPTAAEKVLTVGLGVDKRPDAQILAASMQAGRSVLVGVVTSLPWRQRLRRQLNRLAERGA